MATAATGIGAGAEEGRHAGAGQIVEPERSRQVAEMDEQPGTVGPLGELAVLVGGEARGDEIARLAGFVDSDDEAVARA